MGNWPELKVDLKHLSIKMTLVVFDACNSRIFGDLSGLCQRCANGTSAAPPPASQ